MPRSETPWLVGWATIELLRRKRLKPGTRRIVSSRASEALARSSSPDSTETLAVTCPSSCSAREAVTTIVSARAGSSTGSAPSSFEASAPKNDAEARSATANADAKRKK